MIQDTPLFHYPFKNHQASALSSSHPEQYDDADLPSPSRSTRISTDNGIVGNVVHGASKGRDVTEVCHQDNAALILVIDELSRQLDRSESERFQLQKENRRLRKHFLNLHQDRRVKKKSGVWKADSKSPKEPMDKQYHDRWAPSVDHKGDNGGRVSPPKRPVSVQPEEDFRIFKSRTFSRDLRRRTVHKRSQSCKSLYEQFAGRQGLALMVAGTRSRSCDMIRTVIPEEPDLEEDDIDEAKGKEARAVSAVNSSKDIDIPHSLIHLQTIGKSCKNPTVSISQGPAVGTNGHQIDAVGSIEEGCFSCRPYNDGSSSSFLYHEDSSGVDNDLRSSLSEIAVILDALHVTPNCYQ